jgi:tRNA modification GTPase
MPDTIIALATPPGVSALALWRLSGPDVRLLTDALVECPVPWAPQRLYYRKLRDQEEAIDDVMLSFFASPRSYTGEDLIEITCHGNPLVGQRLLQAYLRRGARLALPGEFTQRAFLHGKLDLTQAEAVLDLIHAATPQALNGAQAAQAGHLGKSLHQLRTSLIELLANLEAYIDFPEEDISPEVGSAWQTSLTTTLMTTERLLTSAPLGRVLREGVRTAIVGSPNVGKSSLFNALLRSERAIVSPTAGTTRDLIESECNIGGIVLRLLDTAGQRETQDAIEAEGIRRAHHALREAELIIHLVDSSQPRSADTFHLPPLEPGQHLLQVAHKIDLGRHPDFIDWLPVSSSTGAGLAALEERIGSLFQQGHDPAQQGWLTINARQEACLQQAAEALRLALSGIETQLPPELISTHLRAGLTALGEVVGLATNEDILDALFQKFCIGK